MRNPKKPKQLLKPRPDKSKIQWITEHPHQKEDESREKMGKKWKKNEPKNPMQRNRVKAKIGAKKRAKSYLMEDQEWPEANPEPAILARKTSREPNSPSFSLAATKEPSRRSQESESGRDEKRPESRDKTHGSLRAKSPGHCHSLQ